MRGAPVRGAPVRILRRGDPLPPAAGEDRSGGGREGAWKDVRGTGVKARHADQGHKPEGNPPHGRPQQKHVSIADSYWKPNRFLYSGTLN